MAATSTVPALRNETKRANLSLSPVAPPKRGRAHPSPRSLAAAAAPPANAGVDGGPTVWAGIVYQLCSSTGPGAADIGRAMAAVDRRHFVPAPRRQYACALPAPYPRPCSQPLSTPTRIFLRRHAHRTMLQVPGFSNAHAERIAPAKLLEEPAVRVALIPL